jgi:hypothetical protein
MSTSTFPNVPIPSCLVRMTRQQPHAGPHRTCGRAACACPARPRPAGHPQRRRQRDPEMPTQPLTLQAEELEELVTDLAGLRASMDPPYPLDCPPLCALEPCYSPRHWVACDPLTGKDPAVPAPPPVRLAGHCADTGSRAGNAEVGGRRDEKPGVVGGRPQARACTDAAPRAPPAMQEPIRFILLYLVIPGWLLAGVADWACHRRTDIAHTSGTKESLLHMLMIGQVGLGVLAASFCRSMPPCCCCSVRCWRACADQPLGPSLRRGPPHVSATEQTTHAYLEAFPLAAYALLAAAHWPQFAAIFGAQGTTPDWSWALKPTPCRRQISGTVGAFLSGLCALRRRAVPQRQGAAKPRPVAAPPLGSR